MSIVTEQDTPQDVSAEVRRRVQIRDAWRRLKLAQNEAAIARVRLDSVRVELLELHQGRFEVVAQFNAAGRSS